MFASKRKNEFCPAFEGKALNPLNLSQGKILRIQLEIYLITRLPCHVNNDESSNIYEVSKKNSEVHVRVVQDRCTLFLRHLSYLLIHGLLEVGKLKSGEKST